MKKQNKESGMKVKELIGILKKANQNAVVTIPYVVCGKLGLGVHQRNLQKKDIEESFKCEFTDEVDEVFIGQYNISLTR